MAHLLIDLCLTCKYIYLSFAFLFLKQQSREIISIFGTTNLFLLIIKKNLELNE